MVEPQKTPDESLDNKQDKGTESEGIKPVFDYNMIKIDPQSIVSECDQLLEPEIPNNQNKPLSDFEHLRITDLTPIPDPEPVLKIYGEVIAVIEDIFTVSGGSKSGKTAAESMLISSSISLSGQCEGNIEGVEVLPNINCRAVIHFDTEQARHKHRRNIISITKRAGFTTTPDHYLSYNIRQLDIEKYTEITNDICNAAHIDFGGIHSIWIDGGADYIADVNDQAKSNEAIKFFEELAIKYHTAVFIIVHTNPGSEKERGHFGSQCQRKSGGILTVKTEGDISVIEAKILRYAGKADIPQLKFKYDKEKGYHVGCGLIDISVTPDAKAAKKMSEIWDLCQKIFSGQKSFDRDKSIAKIMSQRAIQKRTAAGLFALMNSGEMIIKGDDGNYRINAQYSSVLQ